MTPEPSRGRFISFEGGEGAGKSTQIRHLAARLEAAGHAVTLTREPGGSAAAEKIRAVILDAALSLDAMTQLLLFNAARRDHWLKTIQPALESGHIVLCDRFFDSTYAYQGTADGVPFAVMQELTRLAIGENRPDLTLILDLPPELGLARARARRGEGAADSFEVKPTSFHAALRSGFLAIAKREPERCRVIDASGREAEIAERVSELVESVFPSLMAAR